MQAPFRIGTRGSPLAVAQAELVADGLRHHHAHLNAPHAIEIVRIVTTGDRTQPFGVRLMDAGGKGLFTKEIEDALLEGRIDCAVHSMKDVPTLAPDGLVIDCLLPREDPRDAFFSTRAQSIMDLPHGARVGSTSLRRQAILLSKRPDLKVSVFRGNVDTRLRKLREGEVDATLLAVAGLKRLGLGDMIMTILSEDDMLPAPAQGTIGVQRRLRDDKAEKFLAPLHCRVTGLRVMAERTFLKEMDGSCRTPLAALMSEPDPEGRARLDVLAASPDGQALERASLMMTVLHEGDAARLGMAAAQDLKSKMARHGDQVWRMMPADSD
jgi:hydroxymethylbilane synthase